MRVLTVVRARKSPKRVYVKVKLICADNVAAKRSKWDHDLGIFHRSEIFSDCDHEKNVCQPSLKVLGSDKVSVFIGPKVSDLLMTIEKKAKKTQQIDLINKESFSCTPKQSDNLWLMSRRVYFIAIFSSNSEHECALSDTGRMWNELFRANLRPMCVSVTSSSDNILIMSSRVLSSLGLSC